MVGKAFHLFPGDTRMMDRERFLQTSLGFGVLHLVGCSNSTGPLKETLQETLQETAQEDFEVTKSDAEWMVLLTTPQFEILFREGTEFPYTSDLNEEWGEGTYICRACLLPLFRSDTKYDSLTGWPSFWDPIPGQLGTRAGVRFGFAQIEYHCGRCGGHQGHIFGDGPPPTGTRYCNNGVALVFVPDGVSLPALRT